MNTNPNINHILETLADETQLGATSFSNSHIRDLSLNVKGLIRRLEYKYVIEGLGGNWPVAIVPRSGTFIADSKSANISIKAIFCPNDDLCPSGSADVLPYNPNYSYGVEKHSLFATLRAKVSEIDSNNEFLYSQPASISCSNCIPEVGPKITLPGLFRLDDTTQNSTVISGIASGISPKTRYSYTFKVLDATWPVELYPISGTVKSLDDTTTIPTQLVFCEMSDDEAESMGYDVDMCGSPKDKTAFISLELTPLPEGTDTVSILSISGTKLVSNDMLAKCEQCIPYPVAGLEAEVQNTPVILPSGSGQNTPVILPSGSGQNTLPSGSGKIIAMSATTQLTVQEDYVVPKTTKETPIMITAQFDKLRFNRDYQYSFENIDSNWPMLIANSSGMVRSSKGSATMNFRAEFCESPLVCPSGSNNVVPYNVLSTSTKRYSNFRLKLVDPAITGTYYSNNIRIDCTNCRNDWVPTVVSSIVSDNPLCQ